jgi:hypothetical protein
MMKSTTRSMSLGTAAAILLGLSGCENNEARVDSGGVTPPGAATSSEDGFKVKSGKKGERVQGRWGRCSKVGFREKMTGPAEIPVAWVTMHVQLQIKGRASCASAGGCDFSFLVRHSVERSLP